MYGYSFDVDLVLLLIVVFFPFFVFKLYKSSFSFFQKIVLFCLFFYLFGVFWVCFLPIGYSVEVQYFSGFQLSIQYLPFYTISEMFSGLVEYDFHGNISFIEYLKVFGKQIGGNFILLMPMGIALPYLLQINNYKTSFKMGFLTTLIIELLQWSFMCIFGLISLFGVKKGMFYIDYYKSFDVDDLILNTCGFVMGYVVFVFLEKFSLQKRINDWYGKYKNKSLK